MKNDRVEWKITSFGFSFQADKWRAARSSCTLQRCLVPFANPDFNHAPTIAQRYVVRICAFKRLFECAFMVTSRMVNCSLSTVHSKIMFLPYLQKMALNRNFCCSLTGLSVSLVFSPYQSAYSVKIQELSKNYFFSWRGVFVWPSSLFLEGQLNTSSWTECLRLKDCNLVWNSEFKLQHLCIIGHIRG